MKFSVLMSLYSKERPKYLEQALQSLVAQTLLADEVVLVEDGPVGKDILDVIERFRAALNIHSVRLPSNVGLGAALNKGLQHCSYELVARMDADDISLPQRFEKQVLFMRDNPDIVVSSAWIEERGLQLQDMGAIKKVPVTQSEILSFAKRRNPLNHPVTIFRKHAVQIAGGYPAFRKSQDFALWSVLLLRGYQMANLPLVLLQMRTGGKLFDRRGPDYLRQELARLSFQKKIGFIQWHDFFLNAVALSILRLSPKFLKKKLYQLARKGLQRP